MFFGKGVLYLVISFGGLFWNNLQATAILEGGGTSTPTTASEVGSIAKENLGVTASGTALETVKEIHQKEIKMETTLIILKPDCMEKGFMGEVISRFCKEKFEIIGCKMMALTESLLKEHYAHIASLPFFPEILVFMRSRPVIVLALRGDNIIGRVRDLLGPTDSALAPKGTIRGDWGTDKMRNIAHASDSEDSAQNELKRFFKSEELFL
ncbi:MAG: nucleoside-diphosphate kinase [Puniceicoccales bacterium]|jgi:nucleoside-diphosphate kinase|nr:nucleoside-diphosphate kinase [Puniceicoccales bacterium]